MIEGEDDTSSGPKRKKVTTSGGLDHLRGWPPDWFSWSSGLNDVKLINGKPKKTKEKY